MSVAATSLWRQQNPVIFVTIVVCFFHALHVSSCLSVAICYKLHDHMPETKLSGTKSSVTVGILYTCVFFTINLLPSIFRAPFRALCVLRQCVRGDVCVLLLLISHVPQVRAECLDDSTHYVVLWRASERWGKDEDVEKASKCKQTSPIKVRNQQEMEDDKEKQNFNIYS